MLQLRYQSIYAYEKGKEFLKNIRNVCIEFATNVLRTRLIISEPKDKKSWFKEHI